MCGSALEWILENRNQEIVYDGEICFDRECDRFGSFKHNFYEAHLFFFLI